MHRLAHCADAESQIEAIIRVARCARHLSGGGTYMQQVAALNVIEPWTRIDVPVLILYGTSDYVVAPEDHQRIATS